MSDTVKQFFDKLRISPRMIIGIVIAVLLAAAASTSLFSVDATEQAVITRFGKYYKTVGSGLQMKLPFGIDKHYKVPVNVAQTEQFGFETADPGRGQLYRNSRLEESTMLTGDLNIVDVEWIIQYKIVDPRAWLFNVMENRQTIRDISQSVMNMLVGDRAILDVMGPDRLAIENASLELMNENFESLGLGINVIAVKLQNIVPPEGVQAAFEDVNKAIQDMNRLINEGKEAYNSEIPKAQGEAEQQVLVAEGYASERINRAQGDVARFNSVYEEYRQAPAVTRDRLYLEAVESVFGAQEGSTLIDKNVENMLPIKNINTGAQ